MGDQSFLDWPFFEASHRQRWAQLRAWARETLPDLVPCAPGDQAELDATCRRLVASLGAAGWLKPIASREFGGSGAGYDVRSLCLSREVLAYGEGLADFAFAMQGLGSGPIALFGSPEQKARYLPPIVRGEAIAAFALSETEAGSDVAAIATRATPIGEDRLRLDGEKMWISNGGIADIYVVFARGGEEPGANSANPNLANPNLAGAKGLSAYLVPADTPGLIIAERIEVMAPHPLARLLFDGCEIPVQNRIGAPGEGFKIAMATLDVFRPTVGAAALGFARRAMDEALARVNARQLFGASMARLPLVQASLAEMAIRIDEAALMVYRAAFAKDQGAERITREAAMAKFVATENAQGVIDAALQLFGGLGVRTGMKVEALYREIRALRIYEGASEVQKLIIAREILKDVQGHRPLPA